MTHKEAAWAKLRAMSDAAGSTPSGMLAIGPQPYKLFIDDVRDPPDASWTVVRTVEEAKSILQSWDLPTIMSLDHDLGGDETVMQILHWMSDEFYEEGPPEWVIHSANPVGRQNMDSFLKSWRKFLTMNDDDTKTSEILASARSVPPPKLLTAEDYAQIREESIDLLENLNKATYDMEHLTADDLKIVIC